MNMDRSNLGGGFLSGPNCRLMDIEMPVEKVQQGQMGHPMMSHQSLELHPMNMMNGIEGEQGLGFFEAKGMSSKGMSMDLGKGKGIALGHSPGNNTNSEDEEPAFMEDANGENNNVCKDKKETPWQRMKWTDNSVKLLIAVVASVGDEGMVEAKDGLKRKSGVLQKKGKWKMVSTIMISNGCSVSPQQCEDKFNDLNKRFKKLNDILGRGVSCQVVEAPALIDSIPHLTEKAKDEVKKLLGSKHLFYREMCAFHNGQRMAGCHDINLQAHLMPVAPHQNENNASKVHEVDDSDDLSSDDDSYEADVKNINIKSVRMDPGSSNFSLAPAGQEGHRVDGEPLFQNIGNAPTDQNSNLQHRVLQLEVKKARLEVEALNLEKERLKWMRYRSKKDREIELSRLENERMRLENDRMVMLIKRKELMLGLQRSENIGGPHFPDR